jgi:YcxB-like protein
VQADAALFTTHWITFGAADVVPSTPWSCAQKWTFHLAAQYGFSVLDLPAHNCSIPDNAPEEELAGVAGFEPAYGGIKTCDQSGVHLTHEGKTLQTIPWAAIDRIRESPSLFLFRRSGRTLIALPKNRVREGDMQALRAIINEAKAARR